MKTFYKLFILITVLAMQAAFGQEAPKKPTDNKKEALAPKSGDDKDDAGEVSTELISADKNAVFNDKAKYTFEVKNTTNNEQTGKVSYQVFTEKGVKLNTDSVKVKIDKKSTGKYTFEIPEAKPGFYKVNFMVNVTDYDDTTRRAFGIKPEELRSPYKKPADFDAFWQTARQELDKVKPEFKMTEVPDSSKEGRKVYLVEMKSLDNLTIRGWLTVPKIKTKNKKFSVLLVLPGYQNTLLPMFGSDMDFAIFTLNTRGQGNSRDSLHTRKQEYIFHKIEDKNKFVLRGAIMDAIRGVDFIFSRPELRHDNVTAGGGSLGGYLAITCSSLDSRIKFCSCANPILCDIRDLVNETDWPFTDIKTYVKTRPGLTLDKVLNNMDYYDAINFVSGLQCPTLVGLGLLDPIAPPNTVYSLYNVIPAQKHLIMFKDLGHEIGVKFKVYEGLWMRDTFALF